MQCGSKAGDGTLGSGINSTHPRHGSRPQALRLTKVNQAPRLVPKVHLPPATRSHSMQATIENETHTTAIPRAIKQHGNSDRDARSCLPAPALDQRISSTATDKRLQRVSVADLGMDGKGNRSPDFFEPDSSDIEPDLDSDTSEDALDERPLQLGVLPKNNKRNSSRSTVLRHNACEPSAHHTSPGSEYSSSHRGSSSVAPNLLHHRELSGNGSPSATNGLGILGSVLPSEWVSQRIGLSRPVDEQDRSNPRPIQHRPSDLRQSTVEHRNRVRHTEHIADHARPTSDAPLLHCRSELAADSLGVKQQVTDMAQRRTQLKDLPDSDLNKKTRPSTVSSRIDFHMKRQLGLPSSLGKTTCARLLDTSCDPESASNNGVSPKSWRRHDVRPVAADLAAVSDSPSTLGMPVERTYRARSGSVPAAPRLHSHATFERLPPLPRLTHTAPDLTAGMPNALLIDRYSQDEALPCITPGVSSAPHFLPAEASAPSRPLDSESGSNRTLRVPFAETSLPTQGDVKGAAPSPEGHPARSTPPSIPQRTYTLPERSLVQRFVSSPESGKESGMFNVSQATNTILPLSVRRRHAQGGRIISNLAIPCDTGPNWPPALRKMCLAQGRLQLAATSVSEKVEASPRTSDGEYDDAELFQAMRDAYYKELLGSSTIARLFRCFASLRTLKRITPIASARGDPASDAEVGLATTCQRDQLLDNAPSTTALTECALLARFHAPRTGRARYAWVSWARRTAHEPRDADADDDWTVGIHARAQAMHDGLEFIEGWSATRVVCATGLVLAAAAAGCVVYVLLGPPPAATSVMGTTGHAPLGAEGRIVGGLLVALVGVVGGAVWIALWAFVSWAVM